LELNHNEEHPENSGNKTKDQTIRVGDTDGNSLKPYHMSRLLQDYILELK
jgi:hypothetical protein